MGIVVPRACERPASSAAAISSLTARQLVPLREVPRRLPLSAVVEFQLDAGDVAQQHV